MTLYPIFSRISYYHPTKEILIFYFPSLYHRYLERTDIFISASHSFIAEFDNKPQLRKDSNRRYENIFQRSNFPTYFLFEELFFKSPPGCFQQKTGNDWNKEMPDFF